jgi:NADH-quinone oxidoreductase subunit J
MAEIIVFYLFAGVSLAAALGVLLHPNPVVGALHLVGAMVGISGLFFNLNAPFIAAVQIMVYAGAVMVLFLFVVMIFDTKSDGKQIFSHGSFSTGLKLLFGGMFAGLLMSSIIFKVDGLGFLNHDPAAPQFEVRNLSKIMFTDYMFSFEVLGLLLLVIPIGTVALSRIRGGTHAN